MFHTSADVAQGFSYKACHSLQTGLPSTLGFLGNPCQKNIALFGICTNCRFILWGHGVLYKGLSKVHS